MVPSRVAAPLAFTSPFVFLFFLCDFASPAGVLTRSLRLPRDRLARRVEPRQRGFLVGCEACYFGQGPRGGGEIGPVQRADAGHDHEKYAQGMIRVLDVFFMF